MSKKVDEALGETGTPASEQALSPQTFDLADWLVGVQPVRRSLSIYRGDLQARIDELAALEAILPDGDPEQQAAFAELCELTDQMRRSAVVFVIEGHTPTRVSAASERLKSEGVTDEDIDLALVAEQIVSPKVTVETLRQLREMQPGDWQRLVTISVDANTRPTTLNPRFLRSASA